MRKLGRNDPCWCGGGKKYKKCHLASDEADVRKDRELQKEAEAAVDPVAEKLTGEILDGTERWHTRDDFTQARRMYYDIDARGGRQDPALDPANQDGFLDWYIRDFRPASGRTAVEEYLAEATAHLSPEELAIVESWRDGRLSFFEVQRVDYGVGVLVKDFLTGTDHYTLDALLAKQLTAGSCILSRLDHILSDPGDKWILSGDVITLPRMIVRQFLRTVPELKDLRPLSFQIHRKVEELTGEWQADVEMAEMDDDRSEVVSTELACGHTDAVTEEFRRTPDLAPIGNSFLWRGGGGRQVLGTVSALNGIVEISSDTPTRLEILTEMVTNLVGQYLTKIDLSH